MRLTIRATTHSSAGMPSQRKDGSQTCSGAGSRTPAALTPAKEMPRTASHEELPLRATSSQYSSGTVTVKSAVAPPP